MLINELKSAGKLKIIPETGHWPWFSSIVSRFISLRQGPYASNSGKVYPLDNHPRESLDFITVCTKMGGYALQFRCDSVGIAGLSLFSVRSYM